MVHSSVLSSLATELNFSNFNFVLLCVLFVHPITFPDVFANSQKGTTLQTQQFRLRREIIIAYSVICTNTKNSLREHNAGV